MRRRDQSRKPRRSRGAGERGRRGGEEARKVGSVVGLVKRMRPNVAGFEGWGKWERIKTLLTYADLLLYWKSNQFSGGPNISCRPKPYRKLGLKPKCQIMRPNNLKAASGKVQHFVDPYRKVVNSGKLVGYVPFWGVSPNFKSTVTSGVIYRKIERYYS